MSGLIGRKIGMTSLFDEKGKISLVLYWRLDHAWLPKSEPQRLTGMMHFNWVSMTRQKKGYKCRKRAFQESKYCSQEKARRIPEF